MEKIELKKDCGNCTHEGSGLCTAYCKEFSNHEFKCDYCDKRLPEGNKRFCTQEDENDGGQNCCGDKFELHSRYTCPE